MSSLESKHFPLDLNRCLRLCLTQARCFKGTSQYFGAQQLIFELDHNHQDVSPAYSLLTAIKMSGSRWPSKRQVGQKVLLLTRGKFYNIIIRVRMFSNNLEDPHCLELGMRVSVNVLELVFMIFFIFEVGFLFGKQWQLKSIVRHLMNHRSISLPASEGNYPRKESSISHDSTASDCLTMVADKQNLDPQNVEAHFFQERLPFQAPKRSTKANFQLTLQRKGSTLLKVQKYQQVTEFQTSSSLATYQFNKLRQTMRRMSQTDIESDKNGIQLKLNRVFTSNKTEVLIKRLSFKQSQKKGIEIEGLCENGKFKALFDNIKKIGEGGFGSVFEATNKAENKQYAIKKICLKDIKGKDFLREVTIVNHLTHANIVRYYTWWIEEVPTSQRKDVQIPHELPLPNIGLKRAISFNSIPVNSQESSHGIYFEEHSKKQEQEIINHKVHQIAPLAKESTRLYYLYIQMELYKDGTLSEYLKNKNRKVNPSTAFSILKQLLNGLQFLHSEGVIHRDLKPANIFMDHKDNKIKIGDFGLSVFVDKEISLGEYLLSNKLGTPCYMAPEIKETSRIPNPQLLDVYSLGVIYYELLKNFGSEHERVTKLKDICHGGFDLQEYPLQRELIRMMTRSHKTRLPLNKLKLTKAFMELQGKYGNACWVGKAQR